MFFTTSASDNDGNSDSDTDDALVTVIDDLPTIDVDKVADPTEVSEPGEDVTYTYTVTNTSADEAVTIDSLEDDLLGTLAGAPPLLRYQPHAGFTGIDQFSFRASDGFGAGRTATATLANGPHRVSATLHFNDRDELVDFTSDDRPADDLDQRLEPRGAGAARRGDDARGAAVREL